MKPPPRTIPIAQWPFSITCRCPVSTPDPVDPVDATAEDNGDAARCPGDAVSASAPASMVWRHGRVEGPGRDVGFTERRNLAPDSGAVDHDLLATQLRMVLVANEEIIAALRRWHPPFFEPICGRMALRMPMHEHDAADTNHTAHVFNQNLQPNLVRIFGILQRAPLQQHLT